MIAALILAFAAAPPPPLYSGRLLDDWFADLRARDPLVVEEACMILADLGKQARPARPGLRRLLNHPSAPVRTRAALALWQIDRDPRLCLVSLADGLRHGHALPELLDALAEMGPLAAPAADLVVPLVAEGELYEKVDRVMLALRESAVPALVRALDDPRPVVRRQASGRLIGQLGGRLSADQMARVRARLGDSDPRTRRDSAHILFALGEESTRIYAGIALALRADAATELTDSLRRIAAVETRPDPLLPALLPLLSAPDLESRLRAAMLVFEIENRPERVVPVYRKALTPPLVPGSGWPMAIEAVGRLGPAGSDLAPLVVGVLNEEYDRGWAAEAALTRLGPSVVPFLLPLLTSPPAKSRPAVLETVYLSLAEYGPDTVRAIGPLFDRADDELHARLIELVNRLGPDAGPLVPKLLRHLTPGAGQRIATAEALARVGKAAGAATDALIGLTESPADTLAHAAALRALASIGLDPRRSAGLAARARKHPNARVREAGLELLCRRVPADPNVLPYLREALAKKETCQAGLAAVCELGPAAQSVVPRLIELLDGSADRGAAEALAAVGPAARPAIPALMTLLSSDSRSAFAARTALITLAPSADVVGPLKRLLPAQPARAVAVLADCGRAEAYAPLRTIVRDAAHPTELRRLAAYGLARLDPDRARREPWIRDVTADGRSLDPTWLLLGEPGDDSIRRRFTIALNSRQAFRRALAAACLHRAGPAARSFLPLLRGRMADEDPRVRFHAALATWRIGGDLDAVRPVIVRELTRHRNGALRRSFVEELAGLRAGAKPFAGVLRERIDDPDPEVRLAARQALADLEGEAMIDIRLATADDLAAIRTIYDHYVRTSTCTFQLEPDTEQERLAWLLNRGPAHPVTVATVGSEVIGWGALSPWKQRGAYSHSAEASVYVHHGHHRRGVGRALLADLIARARSAGLHTILGGTCAEHPGSIALQEALGFRRMGLLREVGFKFGRWLDVVHLQLLLSPGEE